MTEQETFKTLKRMPYDKFYNIVAIAADTDFIDHIHGKKQEGTDTWLDHLNTLCIEHGWGIKDYLDIHYKNSILPDSIAAYYIKIGISR